MKKRKPGRPLLYKKPLTEIMVGLTPGQIRKAMRVGGKNRQAGIRIMIDGYEEKR